MVTGEADGSKRTVIASGTLTVLESLTSITEAISASISGGTLDTVTTLTNITDTISAAISGIASITHTNFPFPPDFTAYNGNGEAIPSGNYDTFHSQVLSATAIRYILFMTYQFYGSTLFNTKSTQGFRLEMYDVTTDEFYTAITEKRVPMLRGATYRIFGGMLFPVPLPVTAGSEFGFKIANNSGQDCTVIINYGHMGETANG